MPEPTKAELAAVAVSAAEHAAAGSENEGMGIALAAGDLNQRLAADRLDQS